MKYLFGNKVKVLKEGFYNGAVGVVVEHELKLGKEHVYGVHFGSDKTLELKKFKEEELENC